MNLSRTIMEANVLLKKGELEDAYQEFTKVSLQLSSSDMYSQMVRCAYVLKNFDSVMKLLNRVEDNQNSSRPLQLFGLLSIRQNFLDQGILHIWQKRSHFCELLHQNSHNSSNS